MRAAFVRGPLVQSALNTIGVRLLDLPSRYGFHLLLAVRLGVVEAGAFYVVYSITMLAAGFGRLGVDRAITRSVARSMALGEVDEARHALGHGLRMAMAFSVGITLLLLLAAWPVGTFVLRQPDLVVPLAIAAAIVLPQNFSAVMAGALSGLQRVGLSQMIYSWLMPAIFCVLVLLVPMTVSRALTTVAAATVVSAVIGVILLRRHLPAAQGRAVAPEPLLHTSLSLYGTEFIPLLIASAPAFVLGMATDTAEVGRYALAWRIALVINLVTTAIGAMAAPRFAEAYARGDLAGVQRAARHALGLAMLLSVGPIVVLVAVPGPLLSLFGPGYAAGADIVRLLLLGQAIGVCCVALPELLGMTGYAARLRRINGWALLTLIVCLAVFVPLWGAEGAALATVCTFAVNGLFATIAVREHLHFTPLGAFYRGARARLSGRKASAAA